MTRTVNQPEARHPQAAPAGRPEGRIAPPCPNVLVIACMKDEGPFILEWVAYHLSIGVSNLMVLTNDCTDGTDLILDRLDDMGLLRHLPNPSMLGLGDLSIQRQAIEYAQHNKQFRHAEWVIFIDADEFINIKVGNEDIASLLARAEGADALSLNQVVFGSADIAEFTEEPTIERFQMRFRVERPLSHIHPMMFGVKTLTRNRPELFRFVNHRPMLRRRKGNEVVWLDGSGKPVSEEFLKTLPRSYRTAEGTHEIGQINHYAIRSLESFIVQSVRGDAENAKIKRDAKYWRSYNRNEVPDTTILSKAAGARRAMAELLADRELARLHREAVVYHRRRAGELLKLKAVAAIRKQILEMSFPDRA